MQEGYQRVAANQEAPRTIQQFTPLIMKYTHRFNKRAQGLNCAMDAEDIQQELSLVFHKCNKSYDESKGGSFMNFVISAWFNEMNRLMRKDQRNREVGSTTYDTSADLDDADSTYSLFDMVDSGWPTPEQNMEALSSINYALVGLSEQAKVLVETLINPPDSVCHQFELQERGAFSRQSLSADSRKERSCKQINLKFLIHLFEIPVSAARALTAEIEKKVGFAFDFAR